MTPFLKTPVSAVAQDFARADLSPKDRLDGIEKTPERLPSSEKDFIEGLIQAVPDGDDT